MRAGQQQMRAAGFEQPNAATNSGTNPEHAGEQIGLKANLMFAAPVAYSMALPGRWRPLLRSLTLSSSLPCVSLRVPCAQRVTFFACQKAAMPANKCSGQHVPCTLGVGVQHMARDIYTTPRPRSMTLALRSVAVDKRKGPRAKRCPAGRVAGQAEGLTKARSGCRCPITVPARSSSLHDHSPQTGQTWNPATSASSPHPTAFSAEETKGRRTPRGCLAHKKQRPRRTLQ